MGKWTQLCDGLTSTTETNAFIRDINTKSRYCQRVECESQDQWQTVFPQFNVLLLKGNDARRSHHKRSFFAFQMAT